MSSKRLAGVALSLVLSALSPGRDAAPMMLLVQAPVAVTADGNPNIPVLPYLSSELAAQGRVAPVVWGFGDPIFRSAIEDRILRTAPETPTLAQAQAAANELRAEYLLVLSVWRSGEVVKSRAELYRRGKRIWVDPPKDSRKDSAAQNRKVAERIAKKNKVQVLETGEAQDLDVRIVSVGGSPEYAGENAAFSVSRTYAALLNAEPLKALEARPRLETPQAEPGERPRLETAPPVRQIDNAQVRAEMEANLKAERTDSAINGLREAIDAEPFDLERRTLLIRLLTIAGQPGAAAAEARRAADLLGAGSELRVLAARSWAEAGNLDEARRDANEALAREPNNPLVLALRGELQLVGGDIAGAMESLDAAIAKGPSAEAFFARAIARARVGNAPAAKADLLQADKISPLSDPVVATSRYRLLARSSETAASAAVEQLRALLQRAMQDRTAPALEGALSGLLGPSDALSALLEAVPPPARHKTSSQRLLLALKLLSQSISGLQKYLKSPDDEALNEATINLGEASRTLTSARDLFKSEL